MTDVAAAGPTAGAATPPQSGDDLQPYLQRLLRDHRDERGGAVADYIPELARADPEWFGVAVATVDGRVYCAGDCDVPFTIQSVSKHFVYGMALERHSREYVQKKIGVEPTGDAFNSVIALDEKSKRPHNPMVNAGALATTSLLAEGDAAARLRNVLGMFSRHAGRTLSIDAAVYLSERSTGHRNRAICHLMLNFGMIGDNVEDVLDLYCQQCSVLATCRDLAVMGATLANGGVNPMTGETALEHPYVRDVLSVMYTCGLYDYAGEWAYSVGLPAKSGVGGGIVAVAPGRLGIGVLSPRLDAHGNSVRGVRVCREISRDLNLHVFEPAPCLTPATLRPPPP